MGEAMLADPAIAPGVYDDLPAEAYHADPALSSTGARALLPPGCPAKFHHEQLHGRPSKREFDLGTAAHRLVLGDGPDLVCMDYDDWRTKAARAEADEVRAAGGLPLLPAEYDQVQAMADAIRTHPVAGPLFTPGTGRPEVSLFWEDRATGVRRRARVDWLREPVAGRRLVVTDYKTTRSAAPTAIERAVAEYGYHQQAAWYLDAVHACGLAPDGAAFVFVFQEKAPPYVVTVAELTPDALRKGAARNRAGLDIYRDCVASGRWPGYSDGVEHISLPVWADIRDEEYL